jgi:hypothetical protein
MITMKTSTKFLILSVLSINASLVHAACNSVTSKTILRPDRASTVFVTLNQDDPGTATNPDFVCKFSFNTPPPGGLAWTEQRKCEALRDGIMKSAQCAANGFKVSNDSCVGLQSFTVTGTKASTAVTLGISNTGFDQNQDNKNVPLPNYEMEVITPGCVTPMAGQGTQPEALLVLKGVASGVSFIAGQPAAIKVTVDQTNNGGALTTAQINTPAGTSAATVVSGLNRKLAATGVLCKLVTTPFSAIRCAQPTEGSANGFGIATSDLGLFVGNASGPANTIVKAFNGPCNRQCALR